MAVNITSGLSGSQDFTYGGAILTAPNGNIFVVFFYNKNIYLYKSVNGGESFAQETTVSSTTACGGNYNIELDAAMDSSGRIHVFGQAGILATRPNPYSYYDPSVPSWLTWENAAGLDNQSIPMPVAIALSSDGDPHIIYYDRITSMGQNWTPPSHNNKEGGSWGATPEMVSTSTTLNYSGSVHISVHGAGDIVDVTYGRLLSAINYRTRTSGSWGSEGTFTNMDTEVSPKNGLTISSGGTTYRYGIDVSENVYENDVDTTLNTMGNIDDVVSASLYGSTRYILYVSYPNNAIEIWKNSGSGWSSAYTPDTGTIYGVILEWAYNWEYQNGRLNFIYTDNLDIWFDYISLLEKSKKAAFLKGLSTTKSSKGAFVKGGITAASSKVAYMEGFEAGTPAQSFKAAFLKGISTELASKPAYLRGSLIELSDKPAYLTAIAIDSSYKPAYLSGISTLLSSKSSFLSGILRSDVSAYLEGESLGGARIWGPALQSG